MAKKKNRLATKGNAQQTQQNQQQNEGSVAAVTTHKAENGDVAPEPQDDGAVKQQDHSESSTTVSSSSSSVVVGEGVSTSVREEIVETTTTTESVITATTATEDESKVNSASSSTMQATVAAQSVAPVPSSPATPSAAAATTAAISLSGKKLMNAAPAQVKSLMSRFSTPFGRKKSSNAVTADAQAEIASTSTASSVSATSSSASTSAPSSTSTVEVDDAQVDELLETVTASESLPAAPVSSAWPAPAAKSKVASSNTPTATTSEVEVQESAPPAVEEYEASESKTTVITTSSESSVTTSVSSPPPLPVVAIAPASPAPTASSSAIATSPRSPVTKSALPDPVPSPVKNIVNRFEVKKEQTLDNLPFRTVRNFFSEEERSVRVNAEREKYNALTEQQKLEAKISPEQKVKLLQSPVRGRVKSITEGLAASASPARKLSGAQSESTTEDAKAKQGFKSIVSRFEAKKEQSLDDLRFRTVRNFFSEEERSIRVNAEREKYNALTQQQKQDAVKPKPKQTASPVASEKANGAKHETESAAIDAEVATREDTKITTETEQETSVVKEEGVTEVTLEEESTTTVDDTTRVEAVQGNETEEDAGADVQTEEKTAEDASPRTVTAREETATVATDNAGSVSQAEASAEVSASEAEAVEVVKAEAEVISSVVESEIKTEPDVASESTVDAVQVDTADTSVSIVKSAKTEVITADAILEVGSSTETSDAAAEVQVVDVMINETEEKVLSSETTSEETAQPQTDDAKSTEIAAEAAEVQVKVTTTVSDSIDKEEVTSLDGAEGVRVESVEGETASIVIGSARESEIAAIEEVAAIEVESTVEVAVAESTSNAADSSEEPDVVATEENASESESKVEVSIAVETTDAVTDAPEEVTAEVVESAEEVEISTSDTKLEVNTTVASTETTEVVEVTEQNTTVLQVEVETVVESAASTLGESETAASSEPVGDIAAATNTAVARTFVSEDVNEPVPETVEAAVETVITAPVQVEVALDIPKVESSSAQVDERSSAGDDLPLAKDAEVDTALTEDTKTSVTEIVAETSISQSAAELPEIKVAESKALHEISIEAADEVQTQAVLEVESNEDTIPSTASSAEATFANEVLVVDESASVIADGAPADSSNDAVVGNASEKEELVAEQDVTEVVLQSESNASQSESVLEVASETVAVVAETTTFVEQVGDTQEHVTSEVVSVHEECGGLAVEEEEISTIAGHGVEVTASGPLDDVAVDESTTSTLSEADMDESLDTEAVVSEVEDVSLSAVHQEVIEEVEHSERDISQNLVGAFDSVEDDESDQDDLHNHAQSETDLVTDSEVEVDGSASPQDFATNATGEAQFVEEESYASIATLGQDYDTLPNQREMQVSDLVAENDVAAHATESMEPAETKKRPILTTERSFVMEDSDSIETEDTVVVGERFSTEGEEEFETSKVQSETAVKVEAAAIAKSSAAVAKRKATLVKKQEAKKSSVSPTVPRTRTQSDISMRHTASSAKKSADVKTRPTATSVTKRPSGMPAKTVAAAKPILSEEAAPAAPIPRKAAVPVQASTVRRKSSFTAPTASSVARTSSEKQTSTGQPEGTVATKKPAVPRQRLTPKPKPVDSAAPSTPAETARPPVKFRSQSSDARDLASQQPSRVKNKFAHVQSRVKNSISAAATTQEPSDNQSSSLSPEAPVVVVDRRKSLGSSTRVASSVSKKTSVAPTFNRRSTLTNRSSLSERSDSDNVTRRSDARAKRSVRLGSASSSSSSTDSPDPFAIALRKSGTYKTRADGTRLDGTIPRYLDYENSPVYQRHLQEQLERRKRLEQINALKSEERQKALRHFFADKQQHNYQYQAEELRRGSEQHEFTQAMKDKERAAEKALRQEKSRARHARTARSASASTSMTEVAVAHYQTTTESESTNQDEENASLESKGAVAAVEEDIETKIQVVTTSTVLITENDDEISENNRAIVDEEQRSIAADVVTVKSSDFAEDVPETY
ncbi:hypothetical protein FI667_g3110, partial [Globisporangium splendens]